MEADTSKDDVMNGSTNSKDSEEDESFVTKVRTRVSGLFSSSLSRLFKNQQSGVVRPRSTEDDESNEIQPPCKKARGMENDAGSSLRYNENTLSDVIGNLNNEPRIENSFQSIPGPSFMTKKSPQRSVNNTSTPYVSVNREKYVTSECTSGYSSMSKISEGQNVLESNRMSERTNKPSEKTLSERKSLFSSLTLETPSRSLFANTSTSPQDKNTSLSSRRPSFNTSNLASPSFIDRTLTSSRIINSPFYKGSTIYGGASAYGRELGINETRKQQLKNSFLVKPINKQSDVKSFTSLSKTARRILETLEQCSSPMSDVKKVPLPTRTNNNQGLFSKYVAANPYQKSTSSKSRELMVPSVSERLKMKQIQRLQDTTNEIRQIATSSNSNLNNEDYKVATDNQQKHTNKMKTKLTSVRSKAPVIEVLHDIILNPVPLMIPENKQETFKIPEFNLGAPKENVKQIPENPEAENGALEVLKNKINVNKVEVKSQLGKDFTNKQNLVTPIESDKSKMKTNLNDNQYKKEVVLEYTFSKPLVIADNSKSIIAINNFKFSEPLSKKIKISEYATKTDKQKSQVKGIDKMTNGNISSESDCGDMKKSSDSLLEKFRPPQGTWECQTCLIRNKSDVSKCAACETPRVEKNQILKTDTPNFGLQFTKKSDEWDCSTCLVRNKVQNTVCVACSTPKIVKFEANGFCPKSKPTSKEWECDTCWVRNKEEANKCVACESIRKTNTTKASGDVKCSVCLNMMNEGKCTKCNKNSTNQVKFDFPSHLKPPSDSWECGTCLIRNKNDLKACAACETPRVNQGLDIKTADSIKKSDKWECPTCMVRNDSFVEKCPCCETVKPGLTLISKSNVNMFNFGVNKMQFNFGIPKDMPAGNVSAEKTTDKSSAETSSAAPLFKFGLKPETKQDDKISTQQNTPVLSKLTESKSEIKPDSSSLPLQQKDEKEKQASFQFKSSSVDNKSLPVFKFGAPPSDAKNPGADNFKFTPPKPITNDNKIMPTASEGVRKLDNKIPSFVTPASLQNDPSKPLFSFGSKDNNSENQNSKPLFSFGSSSSSTQPGGFNFNPVKTGSALQPSVVPSFVSNAVQQLPNTNQGGTTLKNGGFNFGNTTTGSSQAAVFSFGAAASNPAEASTLPKGGFDFSSAVKPTGGFNFSSPAPTFDASPKPAFNFTGGSIPTFSANPSEGGGASQPVRKYKRAVRRTQR